MDAAKLKGFLDEFKPENGSQALDEELELPEGFPDPEQMLEEGVDPQFVAYSTVQSQVLLLSAMLEDSGIVPGYKAALEAGLQKYMPGFPPMSPVTDSLFFSWALCDLTFGADGDNIGRIALQVMSESGMPDELTAIVKNLLCSRFGIFKTIGFQEDLIVARELVTDRKLLVDAPTGYLGREGQLRFVRLGPPTLPDVRYWTELTTPYVLEGCSADDWSAYLHSVMPDRVVDADGAESTQLEDRLAAVFKNDLGVLPWMEFVFQGYSNYGQDVIYLHGIPSKPESLPHSETTVATNPQLDFSHELMQQARALGMSIIPPSSGSSCEIKVDLTQAQRRAAAELKPDLEEVFAPQTSGRKAIRLPEADWIELNSLVSRRLFSEFGHSRTRFRNLRKAIASALEAAAPPPTAQAEPYTGTVYRLRIDLQGAKPPIWRRIEVPDCSLADLHDAIQVAMGWTDSHLHEFEVNGERFRTPTPFDDPHDFDIEDASDVWLSDLFRKPGGKFHYVYDFGDYWQHVIKVEAIESGDSSLVYPRCVTGRRNCPPEDCGGIWGYEELLDALADPENPEHADRLEWCGVFDPEEFSVEDCNRHLHDFFADADSVKPAVRPDGPFDIHQDIFEDGDFDDDTFQHYSKHLQDQFELSPEFASLPKGEYGFVDCFLYFGAGYVGVTPASMTAADLDEILFDVIPRKVIADSEDAASIVNELNAFLRFVGREYAIPKATKLAEKLDKKAAERLGRKLDSPSNFGMAKSLMSTAQAAGFDISTQEGLNEFMLAYNNSLTSEDEEAPPESPLWDGELSTIRHDAPKVGRNDPCPCGSGKKYKKCCLR